MPSQKARSDAEVLPECHARIAPNGTSGKAETAAPGRHESPSAGQLCGFTSLGIRAVRPQLGLAIPRIGHPIGGPPWGWDRELETLRCRLDAVGRKRSQRTAFEHPACDRHTAFIQGALRCSSAHVRGIGCPFVAAVHPGASIHASFRRASAGVRCVVFGTCGRRQSY